MYLSVDIYIQHDVSEFEFYKGPIKEKELNLYEILNLDEEEGLIDCLSVDIRSS